MHPLHSTSMKHDVSGCLYPSSGPHAARTPWDMDWLYLRAAIPLLPPSPPLAVLKEALASVPPKLLAVPIPDGLPPVMLEGPDCPSLAIDGPGPLSALLCVPLGSGGKDWAREPAGTPTCYVGDEAMQRYMQKQS